MSEALAVQEQPKEKEKKPKKILYSINGTLKKLKEHILEYNEETPLVCKIKDKRKKMAQDLYVLAICHHNDNQNHRDTKLVRFKRKNENGELVEFTTLGITTKVQSLATEFQVSRQTITSNLQVVDGTKAINYNQDTKELIKRVGEAGKRPVVAAPELLERFSTDCYGLLYLLNPYFLVPLESKEEARNTLET